jgi:hypothetical protein
MIHVSLGCTAYIILALVSILAVSKLNQNNSLSAFIVFLPFFILVREVDNFQFE